MYTSMFRKAMLGDTATLNLDFTTTGVLDSRLTFTRSSTGTYINSSGYVTTASTNVARFDYDPVTLAPRGLLVEGQVTNVATNSNAIGNAGGLTRTYPTGIISPDGTANAQRFTKSDTTTPRYIQPTTLFTVPASTAYTVSIWIKYDGYAFTTQIQSNSGLDWGGNWTASFVIAAGGITVGSRTGICSASTVTAYPNDWYRCTATITTGAVPTGSNPSFLIDVVGTTGVSVLVYGVQLELGSSASSYIVTGASGVTRNIDSLTMTGTNFSSWFNSAEGTFLAEFQTPYSGQTTNANNFLLLNSDASKRIMYFNTGAETMATFDGTTILTAVGDVTGSIAKCASTYTSTARSIVSNGGTVTTGAVVAGYSTASSLGIGLTNPNMLIRKLKFYPTALPNANIQTLTAP